MLIPASRELEQTRTVPAREVLLPTAHVTTTRHTFDPTRAVAGRPENRKPST
jgi:hypothetical protein